MSDDGAVPDDDAPDYDSGPYCRHWSDPSDCEEICARCSHRCHGEDCNECACEGWVESP